MVKAPVRVAAPPARLLVVDDDADVARSLCEILDACSPCDLASSAEEALDRFRTTTYTVVVADLQLPGESGLDLVRHLRREAPSTQIVVLTGYASVATAVDALKLGAADYLVKPCNPNQLRKIVERLIRERPFYLPNRLLAGAPPEEPRFAGMVAQSPQMRSIFERIRLVAQTEATVLIVGETGTGKELVARALHECSPRAGGPFIAVHTGALPKDLIESELFGHEKGAFTGAVTASEGKFGAAAGGTIFLDEVSTMPDRAQIDLLRVLETFRYTRVGGKSEHTADVRVVCATNCELLELVGEGKFREDLYYRMAIFPIRLPPLRERPDDIGLLADRFLFVAAERYHRQLRPLPAETIAVLCEYHWPGNVRELRNVIEQAVLIAQDDVISATEMRALLAERPQRHITPVVPILAGAQVVEMQRTLARHALAVYGGDRELAAKALGVTTSHLDALLGTSSPLGDMSLP